MKRLFKGMLVALMVVSSTIGVQAKTTISTRVQNIIDNMSAVDKVAQMIQADTRWISPQEVAEYKIGSILSGGGASPKDGNELENWITSANSYQKEVIDSGGIPLLYGIDAVHGNNNVYGSTIYPHNIGLGAANNTDLVEKIGKAVTSEVRAMGANWTFTPTLGVPHNERWGRTYETFGDNLERVTNLGNAYIKGIEGRGDVLASAKHYLGEGLTTNGTNQGNVVLSDSDYQDLINANMNNPMVNELLTPYKKAISQGVKSIMVTYNSINGKKCHGNKDVVTTLLKERLGFEGIVISDYNGLDQIENAQTYKDKAIACINAGVDVLMVAEQDGTTPRWKNLYDCLVEAVNEGKISDERLNDAVARILTAKEKLGLLDNPSNAYANSDDQVLFGGDEHRSLARKAVSESLVLLKNDEIEENKTIMQALKDMNNLMVAGNGADDIGKQCGGWTISWQGSTGNTTPGTTIFSALKAVMDAKGKTINYSANGFFTNSNSEIDAAIVVVGEDPYAESNGDRSAGQLKLPADDIGTINRIKSDHPDLPIILVLETGRPIALADYVNDDQIKGIVNAWLPGTEGAGVADVLLGDKDFVGTNPITWTWYPQDITSKYDDPSKVLYPVGYGLTKAQKTGELNAPEDPNLIDLGKTNGKLEAESFVDANSSIVLENNGTSVGYLQDGRHMTYKINVAKQAAYKLTVSAAREYADTINGAFEMYLDGELVLAKKGTTIPSTGSWTNFKEQDMIDNVSLKAGVHELKFVARDKDFNIDYFIFEKAGDYVGPIIPDEVTNVGTGAMLKESAVEVSMSSSENSQNPGWYKGEYPISNKNVTKEPLDIRVSDDSEQTTILVDEQKTYQSVLGMGTSIEESTIHNLLKMTDENRQAFLRRLLDPVDGMGMSLIRVTIGTSDFTAQDFYSYYDGTGKELNGKPDWDNVTGKGFSIQRDKDLGIIKVINEMQEIARELGVEDNLKFFASSWTPPGWMKLPTSSSDSYENNELLLKGGKLNDKYIDDLAKYSVRFIEEYQKCGIPIYAITIQNEPLLEINYPSCFMTGAQEAKIAKAIKAELTKSTVLKDKEKEVKLWAFDHNFDGADNFMADFFKEAGKELNIDGIAFHPYGGNASTMGSFYEQYKDQLSMNLTERSVWGTSGANDIITWLRNGSESYNSWVTMLDSNIATHHWVGTPDPTLFVQDANNPQRYWATPEVYIMSQFTKYVKPGFVRIDTNNGNSSTVTNVAFKDPKTGKIIMIVTNQSGSDQKFKVVMNGAQFNAVLPAGNVATYIWDGKDTIINALDVPGTFTADQCISVTNANINTEAHILDFVEKNMSADYLVDVKEAGTYNVLIKVASGDNWENKTVNIKSGDTVLGTTIAQRFNFWGDEWNDYRYIQIQADLEKGIQTLTIELPDGGMNLGEIKINPTQKSHDVPGYISATDYCYSERIIVEDENIGFFGEYDRVNYRLNVQKAGIYQMKLNYASGGEAKFWMDLIQGGQSNSIGEATLKATGNDSTYQSEVVEVNLPEGEYQISFVPQAGVSFNLKSLSFGAYIQLDSDELQEGKLDNKEITVNLTDGKFIDKLNSENWKIEGLPAGINYSVNRINDTKAVITLFGDEVVDYDINRMIKVKVDASEIGETGYYLTDVLTINAIDDDESLLAVGDIKFKVADFDLVIKGGKFNQSLKVSDLVLSEDIANYVDIEKVVVDPNGNIATVTLKQKVINYEDIAGTISVKNSGYSDGINTLNSTLKLLKTNTMPKAIDVNDAPVALEEKDAYRKKGTLVKGDRGNYVDFYLDVKEEGNYILTYRVKDDEAVSNGLKLSGGLGLATDNLGSVSFGKYWGNAQGYAQMLNLKAGEQTLRFEVNNAGFELTDLKIEKLINAIEIAGTLDQTTTVTADKVVDGSKEIGWGIEGSTTKNIGFGSAGAYQDYYIDVKKAGVYDVKVNYSHDCGGDTKAIIMSVNGNSTTNLGEIILKNSGGWSNWKDSDTTQIKLEAGRQFIRIYDDLDGFNYRNFQLTFRDEMDVTSPEIVGSDAIVYVGDTTAIKDLLELSISDDVDGDLLEKANISGTYDPNVAGIYTITVTVEDAAGNVAAKDFKISVVNKANLIVEDNELVVGDKFDPMAGIKVIDIDGTDITDRVSVISNNVDTAKAGKYIVVYEVMDGLENTVRFERTVIVKEIESEVKPAPDGSGEQTTPDNNDSKPQVIPGTVVESTKTGDDVNVAGLILIFALTGLGCMLLMKRKRVNR